MSGEMPPWRQWAVVFVALACAAVVSAEEDLSPRDRIRQALLSALAGSIPDLNNIAEVPTPIGDISLETHFDFIVVGAGPAGCAIASKLAAQNPNWKVLLLEAGGFQSALMEIPLLTLSLTATDANWGYSTVPQKTSCVGLKDSRCMYAIGRAVGGGTAINNFFVVRGRKEDFDAWEAMGNKGWGHEDLLCYFKEMENVKVPELQNRPSRGYEGPLAVTYPSHQTNMSKLLVRMAKELGIYNEDPNGDSLYGLSRIQSTTQNGKRFSAYNAYLKQAMNSHTNLFVRRHCFVLNVIFEGKHAVGVRYVRHGIQRNVYASKEVIISAGAVHSPALLMRSGVGPRDHLEELGIKLVKDLPVGFNLQDHAGFPWILVTMNETMAPMIADIMSDPSNFHVYHTKRQGPYTMLATLETMHFAEVGEDPIEMLISSMSPVFDENSVTVRGYSKETYQTVIAPLGKTPVFQVSVWPSLPHSRGRVYLKSADPNDAPLIDPRALSDPRDRKLTLQAIRVWQGLMQSPALRRVNATLWDVPLTGCEHLVFDSDEYWDCAITRFGQTLFHPCCTNKMGGAGDPEAVVGADLKVHGLSNLRVCDSSVMPKITSGHLQIPSYAIGLKCSDYIIKEFGGEPSNCAATQNDDDRTRSRYNEEL